MTLLIHLAILAVTIGRMVLGQCKVPINELKETTPVFFRNGELMTVHNGNLEWEFGEQTYVTCAGSTFYYFPEFRTSSITCHSDKTFRVDNQILHIDRLICSSKIRETVVVGENCLDWSGGKKWHHIGFVGNAGFKTYYKTCYDTEEASAIYSEHTLQGGLIKYVNSVERDASFVQGKVPIQGVNDLYKQKNTEKIFETLLGRQQLANIKAISFIARGHLTPNADGMMPYFKRSTFVFDNIVPQWQVINLSNWKRVEIATREKAKQLERDLLIFTGVYDVLRLPDDQNGGPHPIYLKDNRLKVPKWHWKIIKDEMYDEAIAFVTFNNPFRAPDPSEFLCKDISKDTRWHVKEFLDHEKGFTYCCTVESLMHIGVIPLKALATEIMIKGNLRQMQRQIGQ